MAWSSASTWLDNLSAALNTPEGEEHRRRLSVRVETVLDVAAQDARAADSRTGRHVATSHATVATLLGCSAKTVQRARTLIEALGHAVTVVAGRYLTREERAAARAAHGGDQRRMASERALTVPRPSLNVHLPRRGAVSLPVQSRSDVPRRAQARARTASRPTSTKKTRSKRPERPLAVQRLAAGLASRLPWLARGHIGALCDALSALDLDSDRWTAQDVIDHLDAENVAEGRYQPAPSAQRHPVGLFVAQARRALAGIEPPVARRRRDAAARNTARTAEAAERAAEQARLAALAADPAAQARISAAKAEIRATLAAQRSRRTPHR